MSAINAVIRTVSTWDIEGNLLNSSYGIPANPVAYKSDLFVRLGRAYSKSTIQAHFGEDINAYAHLQRAGQPSILVGQLVVSPVGAGSCFPASNCWRGSVVGYNWYNQYFVESTDSETDRTYTQDPAQSAIPLISYDEDPDFLVTSPPGVYRLSDDAAFPNFEAELRDIQLTRLFALKYVSGGGSKLAISCSISVYPNMDDDGAQGWKPTAPISCRFKIGHPSLAKSSWIQIDRTIPVSSISSPTLNGTVANFTEIDFDLSNLAALFPNQTLPDLLVVEGRALLDVAEGGNALTEVASTVTLDLDRLRRRKPCEMVGTVNTDGLPNIAIGDQSFVGATAGAAPASLGYGWQMSVYKRVVEDDGILTYHDGNGQVERWFFDNGSYLPTSRDNYVKAFKNEDETFSLVHRDQSVMVFDALNRIETWTDSNGNTTSYIYQNGPTSAGPLVEVNDGHGRATYFGYGTRTDGQPVTVTSHSPTVGNPPVVVPPRVTSLQYFPSGHVNEHRLKKVINPAGETTEYSYTANGQMKTITDTRNKVAMEYEYYLAPDPNEGKVKAEIIYGELRREYTYNESQKLVTITEKDLTTPNPSPDRVTKYVFDDYRNIVETHNKVGATTWNITHKSYQDGQNPHLMTLQVTPNGAITKLTYTSRGNLKSVTDPLNNATVMTYAEQHDRRFAFPDVVKSIKRPDVTVDGVVTSYQETLFSYDETTGNLESITDALGNQTAMKYTADGLVKEITNARGHKTVLEYGGSPRVLQKVKTPKGNLTSTEFREVNFKYDGFDNVKEVIDALGHSRSSTFDQMNRLLTVTDARNETSVFQIVNGRLDNVKGPLPNIVGSSLTRETKMVYDDTSRVREVLRDLEAGGQESRVKYDFDGFSQLRSLTRKKANSDVSFVFGYDTLGRITTSEDPLSLGTNYAYANFCKENSVTSARGVRLVNCYDPLCRLTRVQAGDPDTASTEDPELKLSVIRENREFEYDELGRMTKSRMPSQSFGEQPLYGTAVYGTGKYTAISSNPSVDERRYAYDALDRLTLITFEDGLTMEMEYDEVGNLIRLKDPDGKVSRYTYYRDNLLHKVQIERQNVVVGEFVYTYDLAGRLETLTYPKDTNNISVVAEFKSNTGANGWNENGQLRHLRYLRGSAVIREFEYDYDGAGNRILQIDKSPSGETHWRYTYDWFDRLKKVKKGATSTTVVDVSVYSYDASDNRTVLDLPQESVKYIYEYEDNGSIKRREKHNTSTNSLIFVEIFDSDEDGNLLKRTRTEGLDVFETTYIWDSFDKLISVSSTKNGVANDDFKQENSYWSNGFRRKKKAKSGAITSEYSAGLNTAVAKTAGNAISYIQGHQILGYEQGGSRYFFITDALGTVRDIVDSMGMVVQSYEFNEHGLPMPGSGAASGTFSPKTYQGALSVSDDRHDSGLYLMGRRHYAADLGRFMSRDPIGFAGGLNLFNGHSTNPVTYVDPAGMKPILGPKARKVLGSEYINAFDAGTEQARRRWKKFGDKPFQAIPDGGTKADQQECWLPFNYENYLNGNDDILFELAPESYFVNLGASESAGMVADPDGVTIWIREKNAIADPYDLGQKQMHEPTHSFLFREDPEYNERPPDYAHPSQDFKYGVDAIPLDNSWR